MRISLDLDNLLVRQDFDFQLEPLKIRFLGAERLRLGTRRLWVQLCKQGHEVGVYTSSYRSVWQVRKTFGLHGIFPDFVVNGQRHRKFVKRGSSKYPPAFDIDLHVDDSEGVQIEGQRFGFQVLVIAPEDEKWLDKVFAMTGTG